MGIGLIALRCAGFNNVDLAACGRFGVSVARVPAYSPYAVAEHAIALMMSLNRCVHRASNRIREGNFSLRGLVGFDMHGRTAGIVGAGKIGECVLSILAGFGCRLLVHSRTPKPALAERYGAEFVDLSRLLAESDIISLHAPLTPETHHMIDASAIAGMKRGVMLINTSRGGLVDTRALLNGLKSGHIGYAGLDVYEEESAYFFEDLSDEVMADDALARLTTFNNVIVTSHQAFLTGDALANIAETTLGNIEQYRAGARGGQLPNAVLET
jgi:D-lactate dehydrogenase